MNKGQHGFAERMRSHRVKHGMHGTPTYKVWQAMLARCDRGGYKGKVAVCHRWRDFSAFFADMGERPSKQHSIERKNSKGNYEPANCKWATLHEQNRNRSDNCSASADRWACSRKCRVRSASYDQGK